MNFEEFKKEVLSRAKNAHACLEQYKRALMSNSYEELSEVIKDNLVFNRDNSIVTPELGKNCDKPEIWNIGKDNSGLFNSGYLNSGYLNSGYLNSGYRNSGNLNSGDRNSGYLNSGYRNSGNRNSGDLNSGYRNSGVFCTKKREDTVPFFNKESKMTWDEWYNHPAYYASLNLEITKWIDWESMTDEEKRDNEKSFVCGGYLKVFEYKEAWSNLWAILSQEKKMSFTTLPNFDAQIFEEITGIKY